MIKGVYAITDPELINDAELIDKVAAALDGGASLVQYRHKHALPELALAQAKDLAQLCRQHDCLFIVNDDPILARDSSAHGVHIGRDDPDLQTTREIVGGKCLIGVSCYNELPRAHAAQAAGADYVAFGSFYPSTIKPDAVRADLDLLRRARRELEVPIVAIGGINADNGAALLEAGADALAVISAIFAQPDVRAAAQACNALFDSEP